jgi:multiple sugar transport system substrate-binding protein
LTACEESLRNAEHTSRYDLIAVDLPDRRKFANKGVLMPFDKVMDLARSDPADFHTAGWKAAHWVAVVCLQPMPERTPFYRHDLFAEAGLEPLRQRPAFDSAKAL